MKDRSQLVSSFSSIKRPCSVNILSLNKWLSQKKPSSTWVAGVFHKIDEKYFIFGQLSYQFLENFSTEFNLKWPDSTESLFKCENLLAGDKIAVWLEEGQVKQVMLLAVNKQGEPKDPFAPLSKLNVQQNWDHFLIKVKTFFCEQGFVHLPTPNLVSSTAMEASLVPFQTHSDSQGVDQSLFLPTSPEFHLKRAVADGLTEVFEITPCFRNEPKGFQHLAEFTMLEWYRAYSGLDQILADLKQLIPVLSPQLKVEFKRVSVHELFKSVLNFDLTPATTQAELYGLAQKLNITCSQEDSWNDIYFLIFISEIEPNLGQQTIDVVYNYPPTQAALACLNDEGWTDRFEVYWKGFEIANAYNELTCEKTQRQRFIEEQREKIRQGHSSIPPIDELFMNSLLQGLPFSAGIALGLERLFMALYGYNDISELKYFEE